MSQISTPPTTPDIPAELTVGTWDLAPGSVAAFTVGNLGFKKVRGSVPLVDAHVEVQPTGRITTVRALLDLRGIDTGNKRRDADLAKPKLLDTNSFPTMTFQAAILDRAGGPLQSVIDGTLEAHGHAIPLELHFTLEQPAPGTLRVQASASLDRADLGIKVPSFMIGRQVEVHIDANFRRAG
jgi:polyisoprenoid-binding protein YceI